MKTSSIRLHKNVDAALLDTQLVGALAGVKEKFIAHRSAAVDAYNETADFEALRDDGKQIRDDAINRMPALLEAFESNATAAGSTVLWAATPQRACQLMVDIARQHQVKMAVKSKSMASEEIFLNDALIAAGVETVETDLGEFILQLNNEKPSHIIAPAMHKTRASVSDLFARHLHSTDDNIAALTSTARAHLREKFLAADMGISGANFLIAETGSTLIVTNEGNGRMVTTLPRVHVTLAGIDKIISRFADITPLLALLTRSATGQHLTNYVSIGTGSRRQAAKEGPQHSYIILLDNGRSRLRRSRYRDMLRCIRCGACMNHCPVYQTVGGHAYGSVYMGPMGQVLTPALLGVEKTPDLPYMATMCGACEVVCPVKIPLPTLMRRLREERVEKKLTSLLDRWMIRVWSYCANHPALYAILTAVIVRLLSWIGDSQGQIRYLPGLSAWFGGRNLAAPAGKTFRKLWKTLALDDHERRSR